MGVVPGHLEESIEGPLEGFAQRLFAGLVVRAQDLAGETFELPWVVVGGDQARHQGLPKTAALQGRHTGGQHMLRSTAVDAHGLTLQA
ncbi:hypothetical protein D3C76_1341590 [compost metagenome]